MESGIERRRQKRIRRRKIRRIKRIIASILMVVAMSFITIFAVRSFLNKNNNEVVVKRPTVADNFKKYVLDEYEKRTKDISKVELGSSGKISNSENGSKDINNQSENASSEEVKPVKNDTAYYNSLEKHYVKSYGTQYLIRVNRAANRVTVYQEDDEGTYGKPVISMICSCGLDNDTPVGEFSVTDNKWEWLELVGDVYGKYITQFYGDYLFHSVPYKYSENNTLLPDEYLKLGQNASHGCVRLCVRDAKWIYDNCEPGTPVVIYDDAEHPGPIEPQRLPDMKIFKESTDNVWDPTDPDQDNPWRGKLI